MKKGIHPEYDLTTIQCACGNVVETRSTQKSRIQVEICSACHPHYTGKQRFLDTAGRIERFQKKFGDRVVGTQKAQSRTVPPPPAPVMAKKEEKPAAKKGEVKAPAKTAEKQVEKQD